MLRELFIVLLVFFGIISCGEKSSENIYNLSSKLTNKLIVTELSSLSIQDSIIFELPVQNTFINQNIPIKISKNVATIITKDNVIYYFYLNKKTSKPFRTIKLSNQIGQIKDYLEVNNNHFLVATYSNELLLVDSKNGSLKRIFDNEDGFTDNIRPYLGLSLMKIGNNYVLPYIKIDDFTSGSFLALFDSDFNYIKGLGNSGYENHKCHTPFYDSPIISNINDDNKFYCTFPSTPNSLLFTITSSLSFKYTDEYIVNQELGNLNCIDSNKLFDYKFMDKKYVTDKYGMRLLFSEKNLYRIIKENQSFINSLNRKKNTILDSPFSVHVSDRKTNHNKHFKFEGNKYDFLNGFIYNNLYYLPLKPNENKLTLHAYF